MGSLSILMAVGAPMVAVPSPARTQPRSTGLLLTSADRWPSLWSRVVLLRDALSSFLTPLVWPSHCLFSWKPTEQSVDTSHLMTSPRCSRLSSTADRAPLLRAWPLENQSTRWQPLTATLAASHTLRTASSTSN